MGVRGVRGLWNCVAMEQSGYIREWQNLLLTLSSYDTRIYGEIGISRFPPIVERLQFISDFQVVFLSQVFSATFLLQMYIHEAWHLSSCMLYLQT